MNHSLKFIKSLSQLQKKVPTKHALLLVDSKLKKDFTSLQSYPGFLPLRAGESLKQLEHFESHAKQIFKVLNKINSANLEVWAVGGGSLGDFAGFFSSVYHRGVPLVLVPTTWLSAIDSAHGNKNALNIAAYKNVLGTFHAPQKVFLCRELLFGQPESLLADAVSEVVKISLIDGGVWAKRLLSGDAFDKHVIWRHLPKLIHAKWRVVKKDPTESKGIRQILNLGHTIAHALELKHNLSHGEAVAVGLRFSLYVSRSKGYLSPALAKSFQEIFDRHLPNAKNHPSKISMSVSEWTKFLLQDKKRVGQRSVNFIVIKGWGKVMAQPMPIEEIIQHLKGFGL